MRIGLLAEPLYGVSIVAAGALRGAGDTLRAEYDESRQHLGGAHRACALLLVGAFGLPGMWTAMADGALRAWPFDAVPSENNKIL